MSAEGKRGEEILTPTELNWRKVFRTLQEMAEEQGEDPDENIRLFSLTIAKYGTYGFRLNSAISNPDGKLDTLVVDITHEGVSSQQVVATAFWEEDEVAEVISDLSKTLPCDHKLPEDMISKYVVKYLDELTETYSFSPDQSDDSFLRGYNAPRNYSTNVN